MKLGSARGSSTWQRLAWLTGLGVAFAAGWMTNSEKLRPRTVDTLNAARSSGILRVAAIDRDPYCFRDAAGKPVGLECEPLQGFAASIGTKLQVEFFGSEAEVIEAVRTGRADIGAGGIDNRPAYRRFVALGPTVGLIMQQLIYNRDAAIPHSLDHLDGDLLVVADSPASAMLETLHTRIPSLEWEETREDDAAALLEQVADGDLDYTVADSDLVTIMLQRYPRLRVAFDLGDPRERVLPLPLQGSAALSAAITDYFHKAGPLETKRLEEEYLGHGGRMLSYDDATQFADDIVDLLPKWRKTFEAAGAKYQIDWRLLAAIGYQESAWDNSAISKTGVRGIMMLTSETALELNIDDRGNAQQSIMGAAKYLAELRNSLPASVTEPDRSWMALAAYNIGISHLLDARTLTAIRGGNPDLWRDVRKTLPLLSRSGWYSKAAHGQARGGETVLYVANIRTYYDILAWVDSHAPAAAEVAAKAPVQTVATNKLVSVARHR